MNPIIDGETAYLIPRTLGCASACWSTPQVTVVSTTERPYLLVRLPDGTEIRTHEQNVVRKLPNPPADRPSTPKPRPQLHNAVEVPLW